MGARRYRQGGGGHLPPVNVKCFVHSALAVTVKRSVDQLFVHYFHHFLESRSGLFSSCGLCFKGAD